MQSTAIRLSNASDLARASELLIGFTPVDSIVIIGLAGGRVVVTARVDADEMECPQITQALQHVGATEVAVVVWSDLDTCAITNRAIGNVLSLTNGVKIKAWIITNGSTYRVFGEVQTYPLADMDPVSDAILRIRTEMPRSELLRLLTVTNVNEVRREFVQHQVQPLLANQSFAAGLAMALLSGDESPEDAAYMYDAICGHSLAQRDHFLFGVARMINAKADINYTYERVSQYLTNPAAIAGLAAAALMTGHGFAAGVLADRAPESCLASLVIEHLECGLAPQTLVDLVIRTMEDETE